MDWVEANLEKVAEGPGYRVYVEVNGHGNPWLEILADTDLGQTKKGWTRVIQTSWESFRTLQADFRHSISIWRK